MMAQKLPNPLPTGRRPPPPPKPPSKTVAIAALALILAAPSIAQAPPQTMVDFPAACSVQCDVKNDDAIVTCKGSPLSLIAGKRERAVRFIRVNHGY